MIRKRLFLAGLAALLGFSGLVLAQRGGGGGFGRGGGGGGFGGGGFGGLFGGGGGGGGRGGGGRDLDEYIGGNEPITPLPSDRDGVPTWSVDPHFKSDLFTFVRIRYPTDVGGSRGDYEYGSGRGFGFMNGYSWKNDWPDADLSLSYRLQQLTSLKVDPNPLELEITDPKLFDYPFIYTQQIAHSDFTEEQVKILRRYLLNGGFFMAGDYWGPEAEEHWEEQLRRIFPDRAVVDLPLSHPIFHCVYDLKDFPQIPTLQIWQRDRRDGHPETTSRAPGQERAHYRAILDDKGRIMVLSCQNIDTGDAYQRERDDEDFFHRFSEKQGYPLGINILFYVMTH